MGQPKLPLESDARRLGIVSIATNCLDPQTQTNENIEGWDAMVPCLKHLCCPVKTVEDK
jgi:hypothetical protein